MDSPQAISSLSVADLEALSNVLCVNDKDGSPLIRIGLSASFLFREGWLRPARERAIAVLDEYLQRFGSHLRWAFNTKTGKQQPMKSQRGRRPQDWIPNNPDGEEWGYGFHSGMGESHAAEYQISAFKGEWYKRPDDLGFVQFHLPLTFLASNPGEFQEFVRDTAARLRPFSGWAGVSFLEPLDMDAESEADALLAPLAFRFPGIEINSLISHAIKCEHGIKGVNWLTILSDHFVEAAGGYDYLRIRLPEPIFPFYKYDGGLIIQAGPHPEIGDTTQNRWPQHYVTLAKVLKKIQVKEPHGFHLGGSTRMNREQCGAWLFRFDGK